MGFCRWRSLKRGPCWYNPAFPINGDHIDDDADIESLRLPKWFGNSTSLAASIPVAEYQGRLLQDLQCQRYHGRPAGSLAVPREPLDARQTPSSPSKVNWFC